MMKTYHGIFRGFGASCLLLALYGCDQVDIEDTERDVTQQQQQPRAAAGGDLCGYVYADASFQGKQVALSPTGTCEARPIPDGLLGNVGSAALSPNCSVELLLDDGSSISHSASDKNADRPSPSYVGGIAGGVTSYSCSCNGDDFPLVAEALEQTTRDIAAGSNSLPLWDRGLVDFATVGDGAWFDTTVAALYFPSGKGALLAGLIGDEDEDKVAFPVGAQANANKILDLKTKYSVGIPSEGSIESQDYQDISTSIQFLDPYRVTRD